MLYIAPCPDAYEVRRMRRNASGDTPMAAPAFPIRRVGVEGHLRGKRSRDA